MGSNFRERFVVDTFISPSQTLAILTRKDVGKPETISLVSPQPMTTRISARIPS